MAKLLEVNNLTTRFYTEDGIVHAVNGISFDLDEGHSMAIVGESGSGKSVSMKSIMGIIPSPPGRVEAGEVTFGGRDLLKLSPDEMRHVRGREMAMIFQDPMTSLNPTMTIGDQIAETLQVHRGYSKSQALARAVELIAMVRIPDAAKRATQYPFEFSGGMLQRSMIAMSLACEPSILIADEPTTALDVTIQAQILDLLMDLQKEKGMAIVLITHDLGVVAGHTDEIAVMYGGKLVEKAPTRVLFANMKMPYTEALLKSIPKIEDPSHTRLHVIPGRPPDLVNPPKGCRFSPRCSFVQDRCREEEPPLMSAEHPEHVYACWYPVGSPVHRERTAQLAAEKVGAL